MKLFVRRMIGRLTKPFSPGFGGCYCCNRTWNIAKSHSTKYSETSGCFPLCEPCWKELETPQNRWPFYAMLIHSWLISALDYTSIDKLSKELKTLNEKALMIKYAVENE